MLIISAAQVLHGLDMEHAIDLMATALKALSNGEAQQIIRPVLPLYGRNVLGMMPVYYAPDEIAGVKILSVFPANYLKNVPSHQGQMILFETKTGSVKAVIDADSLTGVRTAAVSAAATDALALPNAAKLAVLGAGLQGRQHLRAIRLVRQLEEVTVWDIRPEAAAAYAREMEQELKITVRPCATAFEAAKDADIICTVTPAEEPILSLADVKEGAHINAVGACTPTTRELAADLMAAGRLFVDWKPAALKEAGDYLLALKDGAIDENHILGEMGQILEGSLPGRRNEREITIFEALGQAIQDLLLADYVVATLKDVKNDSL